MGTPPCHELPGRIVKRFSYRSRACSACARRAIFRTVSNNSYRESMDLLHVSVRAIREDEVSPGLVVVTEARVRQQRATVLFTLVEFVFCESFICCHKYVLEDTPASTQIVCHGCCASRSLREENGKKEMVDVILFVTRARSSEKSDIRTKCCYKEDKPD